MDWWSGIPSTEQQPNMNANFDFAAAYSNQYGGSYNHNNSSKPEEVKQKEYRKIGFNKLLQFLKHDHEQMLINMIKYRTLLLETLQGTLPNDYIVVFVQIFANTCLTKFDILKKEYISSVLETRFFTHLKTYIESLPHHTKKEQEFNRSYWKNTLDFWENLYILFNYIIDNLPERALDVLPQVVNVTAQTIPVYEGKFEALPNSVKDNFEKIQKNLFAAMLRDEADEPLQDFRTMSILPLNYELCNNYQPYLRNNITKGSYDSVHHYLDVHFRLLREDFFGPLRDAINRYDDGFIPPNCMVYKNVKMIGLRVTHKGGGNLIQLNHNIVSNKDLIHGTLVCFTKDKSELVLGTVIESGENHLPNNQIVVLLENKECLDSNSTYMMLEYLILFEPYRQVLRSLQSIPIRDFPLKQFLVYSKFENLKNHNAPIYTNLNESQRRAICDSDNAFSVIQGPPGSGKTYVGLKIAERILSRSPSKPLLVICYTNRALDKFMEGVLGITKDIVRIGGQSKSDKLEEYNMKKLQQKYPTKYKEQEKEKQLYQTKDDLQYHYDMLYATMCSKCVVNFDCFTLVDDTLRGTKVLDNGMVDNLVEMYGCLARDAELENIKKQSSYLDNYYVHKQNNSKSGRNIKNDIIIQTDKYFIDRMFKTQTNLSGRPYNLLDLYRNPTGENLWLAYGYWLGLYRTYLQNQIVALEEQYEKCCISHESISEILDVLLLRERKVIGVTTTAAARMRSTLETVGCSAVIVEEAAQVLEAHIITALSGSCKKLVLIGDHMQLRPRIANFHLEKEFNLSISLFERMVRNNMKINTLDVQHRMRKEIAALISPAFYNNLKNADSVETFPNIAGVDKPVFFVTHMNRETNKSGGNKENDFEAKYCILLAKHLVANGHKASCITILTPYQTQHQLISQRIGKHENLKNVVVAVCDEYQGEENDIVLLSLVRNNADDVIGFLGWKNRACVALSRAKYGLYILGCADIMRKSTAWSDVIEVLEKTDCLGKQLALRCQNHPNELVFINSLEDFKSVKTGGCNRKCNKLLNSGGQCYRTCHYGDCV